MQYEKIRTVLIAGLTIAAFLFVFDIYLPSKIDAASPALIQKRETAKTESAYPKPEISKPAKKSIAPDLGVPEPTTNTYKAFTAEPHPKSGKKTASKFTVPEAIKTEVNFWHDIYTKYDKTKVVFHDKEDLGKIYTVIDVSDIVSNDRIPDEKKQDLKQKRVEEAEAKISQTLSPYDRGNLRSQTGVADKFKVGIKSSGKYIGEIEKIFESYGVPVEISRLAFVESMFNLNALSKVGASGIWQFMPSTGKLFLTINRFVDERNDPIMATHAAAKHLHRDYDALGSWPLAINAYNAGPASLARASRSLGTRDISRIIKEYSSSGYGFASRNFYPAFLAALDVFENREKYFGKIEMDPPLSFDVVRLPLNITLDDLSNHTKVPVEDLVMLNPHLQEGVVSGDIPLSAGFELKVPPGKGEDTLVAISEMSKHGKLADTK